MSLSINNVTLAGNLTRDPELRMLGEQTVVQFALAINRRWKDANGVAQGDVTYVDVEAWGKTAEVVGKFLLKGSPCYLEGRLKLDTWQDKDGKDRQRLKVVARRVQLMSPRARDDQDPIVLEDADHAEPAGTPATTHLQAAGPSTGRQAALASAPAARITAKPATKTTSVAAPRGYPPVAVLEDDGQPPF